MIKKYKIKVTLEEYRLYSPEKNPESVDEFIESIKDEYAEEHDIDLCGHEIDIEELPTTLEELEADLMGDEEGMKMVQWLKREAGE